MRSATVSEAKGDNPPPLVERWLQEQQQWQRTILGYLDSMVKNDDFLVHLGNAMRGSLLAGKPYPTAPASPPAQEAPPDDRLDRVLFALHEMQGQLTDLRLTLDELRNGGKGSRVARAKKPTSAKATVRKAKPRPRARAGKAGKSGKARRRG